MIRFSIVHFGVAGVSQTLCREPCAVVGAGHAVFGLCSACGSPLHRCVCQCGRETLYTLLSNCFASSCVSCKHAHSRGNIEAGAPRVHLEHLGLGAKGGRLACHVHLEHLECVNGSFNIRTRQ
eukprot:2908599-Prymnesium_polylepis.3